MKLLNAMLIASLMLTGGCVKSKFKSTEPPGTNKSQDDDDESTAGKSAPMIAADPATSSQCASGGFVYSVYTDLNLNAIFDGSDSLLSQQILCNGVAGANGSDGVNGVDGSNGVDGVNGANGSDGLNGNDGVNGQNGVSMVFETVLATAPTCMAGGSTVIMALDSDGSGNVSAADQNIQSLTVCNGVNGSAAPVSPLQTVDTIFACGETVPYKEVLLLLQNGQVLASVSSNAAGDMTRLAFLPDGTYLNTDTSGCTFSLATSPDGHSRSVSWNNTVQKTWAMP